MVERTRGTPLDRVLSLPREFVPISEATRAGSVKYDRCHDVPHSPRLTRDKWGDGEYFSSDNTIFAIESAPRRRLDDLFHD